MKRNKVPNPNNKKRPRVNSRRPYMPPMKITQTGKGIKNHMKRLRVGKA